MSIVNALMEGSELVLESVAADSLSLLCSLPPGTMNVVNSVFSSSGREHTQQTNSTSNSEKEFWKMVGAGLGGALAGWYSQSNPTWQDALSGAGSGLQSWAEEQSGGSIDGDIRYDHRVNLNNQKEEFAYITSSRSLADTHSCSYRPFRDYSNANPQQSLAIGEKAVLAANDLRKNGYYQSKQFNDLVETALTGRQREQAKAIKKVSTDLEYYRGI